MKTTRHVIELLEARIAPASVFHYLDVDGDKVTISSNAGDLNAADVTTIVDGQLQRLDLSAPAFHHASITFRVSKVAGGDGLADVGVIAGGANDFGKITMKGDLGQIDAGSGEPGATAIQSLSARSMGTRGLETQDFGGDLTSEIHGALGSLKIAGDVTSVAIDVSGGADAKIGSINIGGSLIGGGAVGSGSIRSAGDMGTVKIQGSVRGGDGFQSGLLMSAAAIGSITIGGSLIGGDGSAVSGEIFSGGAMGKVKIGHEMQGGAAFSSGLIHCAGSLAGVTVGGSLTGGTGGSSGEIFSEGNMGAVKVRYDVRGGVDSRSGLIESVGTLAGVTIGGSLIGGTGSETTGSIISRGAMGAVKIGRDLTGGSAGDDAATITASGVIESTYGRIASVTIGGSIISGLDTSAAGDLIKNASIRAGDDLGALSVRGSLIGHRDANGDSLVIVSARGQAVQSAARDLAIGKISIGGGVESANIVAGYNSELSPVNGDAQIGAVKVGGSWRASNLVAGAQNLGADDLPGGADAATDNVSFGDSHDVSIAAGSDGIVAKIARVTIKSLSASPTAPGTLTVHFGFVAEEIGAIKIGGKAVALTSGPSHDNVALGDDTDLSVHEV